MKDQKAHENGLVKPENYGLATTYISNRGRDIGQ